MLLEAMKRILITGMSGAGKSSVIEALRRRGLTAVDTDSDQWCKWVDDGPHRDWIWHEDRMQALLQQTHPTPLFVSGCKSNQGKFYPLFDHVVLLTAPLDVLLHRIATRQTNPYGKREAERDEVIGYVNTLEPRLRATSNLEINTAEYGIEQVADQLIELAQDGSSSRD